MRTDRLCRWMGFQDFRDKDIWIMTCRMTRLRDVDIWRWDNGMTEFRDVDLEVVKRKREWKIVKKLIFFEKKAKISC